MSWFEEGGSGQAVDVAAILDSKAVDYLAGIIVAGAMVSLGTTSDGGAFMVQVTLDGEWRRQYFRDANELVDWLEAAEAGVKAEVERRPASPGHKKRARRS